MIKARFLIDSGKTVGFIVSGHAGYAESGHDIVCAGVSASLMLTVNAITENFGVKAECEDLGNEIRFTLVDLSIEAVKLIEAFRTNLEILSNEFSGTISIENMEV